MFKYYDPAIHGDTPIDDVDGYNGKLYVSERDYATLEARVAELEKDAARYRWLRDYCGWTMTTEDYGVRIHINLPLERPEAFWDVDEFDAAIDAAMRSVKG